MPSPHPITLALALALSPAIASAQTAPRRLGDFESWTAATLGEGIDRVCYAFASPSRAEALPGRGRVLLTITHRAESRDAVVFAAGYPYPRRSEPTASIGGTDLPLYVAGENAAPVEGAAALRALRSGRRVIVRGPGPNGRGVVADTIPLAGFAAAYEAITRACPPAATARR